MSGQVWWILELDIQPGRENHLRSLATEMIQATKTNEPGTLDYQWSISADGKRCHIFERYADSAAMLAHVATFSEKFVGRFLKIFSPVRFVVYGSPNPDVRNALVDFRPAFMETMSGISR